jgi:DNA-binding SARP family transcriptional activator
VDGAEVRRPELRRCRVRELLGVLALRESATRDELMDLLWPDLPPDDAAGNLRVTLSYLRRALEPDRPRGTPSYHLRVDGDTIALRRSAALRVDLDDLRERLAGAPADPADSGDPDARLAAAVGLWRAEPLTDLARLPAFVPDVTEVEMLLTDAALLLGERRLAGGDTGGALRLAERVLAADPVAERALRLLLAARLHRGEPVAVAAAVRRIEAALADLGAGPEPATAMLVRRARITLAPGSRPARDAARRRLA